jgi:hypothetical protein
MQWGGRSIGLLLLLLLAGVALTLATRVEVPGLSRLLPVIDGSSELFDAPARRNDPDRQLVGEGKVIVPNTSSTVDRVRDLPVPKPSSVASTVEPVAERPAVTQVRSTDTTPTTTPSTAPSLQSSPTPGLSPTGRPRNPNAAVPRENPNAQGSTARAPGQAKGNRKGKAGSGPSPEAGVEPTTP